MEARKKALGLAEILNCVEEHVNDNDISNCFLVSKMWKQTFEYRLWRTFTIKSVHDQDSVITSPNLSLMERNAPYIHKLTIHDISQMHEMFYRRCSQLEDLSVSADLAHLDDAELERRWAFLAEIVREHPRLQSIQTHKKASPTPSFLNALSGCRCLTALATNASNYSGRTTEMYMRINSAKMRQVSSELDTFDEYFVFPDDLWFPEMQRLRVCSAKGMMIDTQLQWISRCPNLKSLHWKGRYWAPVADFCRIIPTACPNLTELSLDFEMGEEDVASILTALPKVEKLLLFFIGFHELSMIALRRHFSWLTCIDLQCSFELTSAMIHEVLCSCPALESLRADFLHYGDIVAQPKPWVCMGLKLFDVSITVGPPQQEQEEQYQLQQQHNGQPLPQQADGDGEVAEELLSHAHTDIYARLAQLTRLEHLSLGLRDDETIPSGYVLKLTPEAGFGSLATLKRLEHFKCKTMFDNLTTQEIIKTVKWMLEHWPNVGTLEVEDPFKPTEYLKAVENKLKEVQSITTQESVPDARKEEVEVGFL
ncbi:hypothetical protein BGX28_002161 [Mortierella sp. GBA30]|nr:hypothetical protein BGX28_002161 [Mortierella sp. GBA30]